MYILTCVFIYIYIHIVYNLPFKGLINKNDYVYIYIYVYVSLSLYNDLPFEDL